MKRSSILLLSGIIFVVVGIFALMIIIKIQLNKPIRVNSTSSSIYTVITAVPDILTKKYDMKDFTGINVSVACSIEITQNTDYSVDVDLPENIAEHLNIQVQEEQLDIFLSPGVHLDSGEIMIRISMPELTSLKLSGENDVYFSNFSGDELSILSSGTTKIIGRRGWYENVQIDSSGTMNINIEEVAAVNARINASGEGIISLAMAGGKLTTSISGNVQVLYT